MPVKIKILVCESDSLCRRFFSDLGDKMNMEVICVNKGPSAIEEAKKQDFYCVFLDSKLALDEAFNTFKGLVVQNPNLPIFIMVESAADPYIEKALNAGARGTLFKPPEMDKINSAIQALEAQRFFQAELERAVAQVKGSPESPEAEAKVKKISDLVRKAEEVEQIRKQGGVK